MLKRIMVALAGLFLMFGLVAAPASGTQTTLDMYDDFRLEGVSRSVDTVPQDCQPTPIEVRSAENLTATDVEFYLDSTCSENLLATVEANGGVENVIFDEVQETGATHYKAG